MIDFEENEIIARYKYIQSMQIPKEDYEVIVRLLNESLKHAKMLMELLSSIVAEAEHG